MVTDRTYTQVHTTHSNPPFKTHSALSRPNEANLLIFPQPQTKCYTPTLHTWPITHPHTAMPQKFAHTHKSRASKGGPLHTTSWRCRTLDYERGLHRRVRFSTTTMMMALRDYHITRVFSHICANAFRWGGLWVHGLYLLFLLLWLLPCFSVQFSFAVALKTRGFAKGNDRPSRFGPTRKWRLIADGNVCVCVYFKWSTRTIERAGREMLLWSVLLKNGKNYRVNKWLKVFVVGVDLKLKFVRII